MSVQDLEARIEVISVDIERQKALLRRLERDKSLLQRQLNAARDPVGRLPLEISSEIFAQCLPPYPKLQELHQAPALLLKVCNAWTDIALSHPKLWAKMGIDFRGRAGLTALVEKQLQRASSHLLDVTMVGPPDPTVVTLLWRHSRHLGRLALTGEQHKKEEDSDDDELVLWDLLAGTQPEPLPLLHTLQIYGGTDLEFSRKPILQLLSLAPNISDLILWAVELVEDEQGLDGVEDILLPNLRRVVFGRDDGDFRENHEILQHIRAPRLETLTLESPVDDADIISFLRRSSPPLQEVIIGDASDSLGGLDKVLTLVPTVTRLELEWLETRRAKQLFNILAPTSGVLPNLRVLELNNMEKSSKAFWNAVLDVLSARRAQLRTVRFAYRYSFYLKSVPAEVLTALRALVDSDGMDIWLGTVRRCDHNVLFSS